MVQERYYRLIYLMALGADCFAHSQFNRGIELDLIRSVFGQFFYGRHETREIYTHDSESAQVWQSEMVMAMMMVTFFNSVSVLLCNWQMMPQMRIKRSNDAVDCYSIIFAEDFLSRLALGRASRSQECLMKCNLNEPHLVLNAHQLLGASVVCFSCLIFLYIFDKWGEGQRTNISSWWKNVFSFE